MPMITFRDREDGTFGVRFEYDPVMVQHVKNLLSRGWDKSIREWWVPKSCAHDLIELAFTARERGWRVNGIEAVETEAHRGNVLAEAPRAKRLSELHPEVTGGGRFSFRSALKPYDHQVAGVAWLRYALKSNRGALLLDEMGLGKTKQIIDVARMLLEEGAITRVVIVCPATLKSVWRNEIMKNVAEPGRIITVEGTARKRKALEESARNEGAAWVIYNYESTWRSEGFNSLCFRALLVADEAHKVKNEKSKQSKALVAAARQARRCILATGSPVVNASSDLFNLVQIASPGLLGSSRWRFEDRYAVREYNGFGWVTVGHKDLHEVNARVARVALRRLKSDCLDLPPKTYRELPIEMSGEQLAAYMELIERLRATLTGGVDLESVLEGDYERNAEMQVVVNAAIALLLRLQQVADGFGGDGERAVFFDGGGAKMQALDDIVDEIVANGDGKLVIWSRFVPPIKYMMQRYAEHSPVAVFGEVTGRVREEAVRDFQDGNARIFIGQIHTAGLGLTLTAARDQVFLSRWWSPAVNVQAEDRLHRIGQHGTVTVTSLLATLPGEAPSIDQIVAGTLARKVALAGQLTGDSGGPTLRDILEAAGMGRAERAR